MELSMLHLNSPLDSVRAFALRELSDSLSRTATLVATRPSARAVTSTAEAIAEDEPSETTAIGSTRCAKVV